MPLKSFRVALVASAFGFVAGCASSNQMFVKPGATAEDFELDKKLCHSEYYKNTTIDQGNSTALADMMLGLPQFKGCMSQRGWVLADASLLAEDRPRLGFYYDEGGMIDHIEPASPAEAAGLKICDMIVEFNGKQILYAGDLALAAPATAGVPIDISVMRDGELLKFTATSSILEASDEASILEAKAANKRVCDLKKTGSEK